MYIPKGLATAIVPASDHQSVTYAIASLKEKAAQQVVDAHHRMPDAPQCLLPARRLVYAVYTIDCRNGDTVVAVVAQAAAAAFVAV
jgi:hypothetical protein